MSRTRRRTEIRGILARLDARSQRELIDAFGDVRRSRRRVPRRHLETRLDAMSAGRAEMTPLELGVLLTLTTEGPQTVAALRERAGVPVARAVQRLVVRGQALCVPSASQDALLVTASTAGRRMAAYAVLAGERPSAGQR